MLDISVRDIRRGVKKEEAMDKVVKLRLCLGRGSERVLCNLYDSSAASQVAISS